jgi:hypothetical protein
MFVCKDDYCGAEYVERPICCEDCGGVLFEEVDD